MLTVDYCDVYIPCRALSQSRSVRGHHPFLGVSNKRAKIILLQIEGLKDQVWEYNPLWEVFDYSFPIDTVYSKPCFFISSNI